MTACHIRRLSLTHFRSYRAASVSTHGDLVVLVGPNGAGKTNCLEAISFLSPGRGLRRATLEDVADNQSNGAWAVSAEVEGGGLGWPPSARALMLRRRTAPPPRAAAASIASRSARRRPLAITCAWCG